VVQPSFILVDAAEFGYPILSEEFIKLERFVVRGFSISALGLIKNKHYFGEITITHFLQKISDVKTAIIFFNTQMNGLRWFLAKH
jgi:hypothetical protein